MKTILLVALAALLVVTVAGAGAYAYYGGCWGDGSGPGWMNYGDTSTDYGNPPAGSKSRTYSRGYRGGYGYGPGAHGMWGWGHGPGMMGYGHHWGW